MYICYYLLDTRKRWKGSAYIKKKGNNTYIYPVCKLPRIFLCVFLTLSAHIRSSFYGDKHQKLQRKLNTCAFFYLFFFLSPSLHVPTYLLTLSTHWYVLHTLNNIREIRCVSFYFHSLTVRQVPTTLIGVMQRSAVLLCKHVTDTDRKISLCK